MSKDLIIPSEIPWKEIKGKDLEELLYWLFDSMGAKELEWRIGGKGAGTSDQGRDLELSFYMSAPDGNLTKQKWWAESKGRKGTVEPSEVHEAVLNASGKSSVDVLVIATNSNFSNPTRDWVKEWQTNNPRPVIKLWEKTELENLCSKNPLAVIRLHSKALSSQGRLQVVKSKLWDYATYTDEPTLRKLWKEKTELEISPRSLFALVASEVANGDIAARAWGVFINTETLAESLANGLINFLYLACRVNEMGARQFPLIKALSYMILVSTQRLGVETTSKLLSEVWNDVEGREYPEPVIKMILEPVVGLLQRELRDVCTTDCTRISTSKVELSDEEVGTYWDKLTITDEIIDKDNQILVIEATDKPCKVGINVDKDSGCPLCNIENPHDDISSFLQVVDTIVRIRSQKN